MKTHLLFLAGLFLLGLISCNRADINPDRFDLVWSDEFDSDSLNPEKWEYRAIGPRRDAYNSRESVGLDGKGNLYIKTFKRNDSLYTGMIGTQNTFQQTFGYYECRVRMQKATGCWTAFWLQSPSINQSGNVAKNGAEIDIFEYLRRTEDSIQFNIHWDGYGDKHKHYGHKINYPDIKEGFHTIGLLWLEDEYVFYIDRREMWRSKKAISKRNQYIILSTEVGDWGGEIEEHQLPDSILFDYIRVYKTN